MPYFPKQISLADIIDGFDESVASKPVKLFKLLDQYFDISTYIPLKWHMEYKNWNGRPRKYSLKSLLYALFIQRFLSIPTTKLLVNILSISETLSSFCGFFDSIPDESVFCRFKKRFVDYINDFFHNLVDKAQSICLELDPDLARTLIADTTGFEAYVKENNPKFFTAILNKLKESNPSLSTSQLYALAASSMPKGASCDDSIRLQYVNGHYAYAHKGVIVTNGLGIPLYIDIPDNSVNPNECSSSSASSEGVRDKEQDMVHHKALSDSGMFIPALENLLKRHRHFCFDYVLGDSGFDATKNYQFVVEDMDAIPIIPINPRNSDPSLPCVGMSADGTPTCPRDPNLAMRYAGICKGKNRSLRIKYECPRMKRVPGGCVLSCSNPCTTSKWGRMTYVYPKDNYRVNTPIPRNSDVWDFLYARRIVVEQTISRLKLPLLMGSLVTRDRVSIKADLLLAGCVQLITLIVAYRAGMLDKMRSSKSLVA